MKKYHVKYVPTNTPILNGDIVMTEGKRLAEIVSIGEDTGFSVVIYLDDETTDIEDSFEKVKLMLCSRDIKIGDFVWMDTPHEILQQKEVTKIDGDKLFFKNDGENYCLLKYCSKVVGEISSGAKWVKENDEFDEEEIKRDVLVKEWDPEAEENEYTHYHPKGDQVFVLGKFEKLIKESPIEILCNQCETFH